VSIVAQLLIKSQQLHTRVENLIQMVRIMSYLPSSVPSPSISTGA